MFVANVATRAERAWENTSLQRNCYSQLENTHKDHPSNVCVAQDGLFPTKMYGRAPGGGYPPLRIAALVVRCTPRRLDLPGAAAFWGEPAPAITQAWCCWGEAPPPLGPRTSAAVATADQNPPRTDSVDFRASFDQMIYLRGYCFRHPTVHPSLCFRRFTESD